MAPPSGPPATQEEKDRRLRNVKAELKALVISTKEQIDCKRLNDDYRALNGRDIPFQDFGFRILIDFLNSIPDCVQIRNYGGYYCVQATADEKTEHLQRLVMGQRKKTRRRKAAPPPVRWLHPSARGGRSAGPIPRTPMVTDKRSYVRENLVRLLEKQTASINMNSINYLYFTEYGQRLNIRATFNQTAKIFFMHEMKDVVTVQTTGKGVIYVTPKHITAKSSHRPAYQRPPQFSASAVNNNDPTASSFPSRGTTPQLPYSHVAARASSVGHWDRSDSDRWLPNEQATSSKHNEYFERPQAKKSRLFEEAVSGTSRNEQRFSSQPYDYDSSYWDNGVGRGSGFRIEQSIGRGYPPNSQISPNSGVPSSTFPSFLQPPRPVHSMLIGSSKLFRSPQPLFRGFGIASHSSSQPTPLFDEKPYQKSTQSATVRNEKQEPSVRIPRPAELCNQVLSILDENYPDGIPVDKLGDEYSKKFGFELDMNKQFHKSWHVWLQTSMKEYINIVHDREGGGGYIVNLSENQVKKRSLTDKHAKPQSSQAKCFNERTVSARPEGLQATFGGNSSSNFRQLESNVSSAFPHLASNASSASPQLASNASSAFPQLASNASSAFPQLASNASSTFPQLASNASSAFPHPTAAKADQKEISSKSSDEKYVTTACHLILSRNPNGITFDEFIRNFEKYTHHKWYDNYKEVLDCVSADSGVNILFEKVPEQPEISPMQVQPSVPPVIQKAQFEATKGDVDIANSDEDKFIEWLYEQLLAGPLSLDEIHGQCAIESRRIIELVSDVHKNRFNLQWKGEEAYIEAKKVLAPVQKETDCVLTEVAPVGTRIPIQEIPGISAERLNNMENEDCNRYVAVYVSQYYAPDCFYIQFKETWNQLDCLMKKIDVFYNCETGNQLTINGDLVIPGIVCAAPYADLGYHRAQVREKNSEDGTVTVFYMDYGTIDVVKVSELRRLLKVFCELPAQAVETEIPDLAPVGETWSPEVQDKFLNLCELDGLCGLWAFLLSKERRLVAELTKVDSAGNETHISEVLVEENLVERLSDVSEKCSNFEGNGDDELIEELENLQVTEEEDLQWLEAELGSQTDEADQEFDDDPMIDAVHDMLEENKEQNAENIQMLLVMLEHNRMTEHAKLISNDSGEDPNIIVKQLEDIEGRIEEIKNLLRLYEVEFD